MQGYKAFVEGSEGWVGMLQHLWGVNPQNSRPDKGELPPTWSC